MIAFVLLAAAPATPLALLLACLWPRARERMPGLLWLAPLPALAAAVLDGGGVSLTLGEPLLRLTLTLDFVGRILLGAAAVLWIAAGVYAKTFMHGQPDRLRFAVFWLMTLTGSVGVFLAADIGGFFLAYCLVSLSAWGLVVHDDTPGARRAGGVYVTFAVLGETLLLMGLVLLAASTPGERLLIRDAVAALAASPWRGAILMLLITGFGAKIALLPLHVWMPLSYRAAPIPAATVMGGAAVKAGVIGLLRFLPLATALPDWGGALVAVGLLGAFWGVAVGITQDDAKTVLAYSSISQMGFIAAVLGMAQAAGEAGASTAVAFYAGCHVLVKGGLFLAIGVAEANPRRRVWTMLLPAAILGLGLAGLPFTGVGLAKLAVKSTLGAGLVGLLAALAAGGTTLLMLHFLTRVADAGTDATALAPSTQPPVGLVWPWLAVALVAVAAPWALYQAATGGRLDAMVAPPALWSALWPVLLGAALAVLLHRWWHRLPRVPEGDLLALGEDAARVALVWGAALERVDGRSRRWPVAAISLLSVAIVLGAAMLAGR